MDPKQNVTPIIPAEPQASGTAPTVPDGAATVQIAAADATQPIKAKGKKHKKKKLTKEEKKALKLEKKRLRLLKIENNKKQMFYDSLTRELTFTKKSNVRGNEDWEGYCLDAELPKARLDLKTAIQNLNRMLDVKDHTIDRLKQNREMADEQYRRNVQKHTDIINYLMKLFALFVRVLKEDYDNVAYEMLKDFHIEIRNKDRVFNRRKAYYDNLLFATNLLSINFLDKHKSAFLFKQQEMVEHKFMVIDTLHNQMLVLHNQMITIMRELTEPKVPPSRLKLYDTLLLKNDQAEGQFKKMTAEKRKIEKVISSLKVNLAASELKYSKTLSDLKFEKRVFKANFEGLKVKYDLDMVNDQSQIRILAASAVQPVKHLTELEKYGQRIIGVAAVARKYETEKEKIVPFPDFNDYDADNIGENIENMALLNNFMYKVSKVEYNNRRLAEERDALAKENDCARECLRRYCHEQTYNSIIASLRLNNLPTSVAIPTQEASQMIQITSLKPN